MRSDFSLKNKNKERHDESKYTDRQYILTKRSGVLLLYYGAYSNNMAIEKKKKRN